ncbi:hypothetical protein FHX57_006335 [Paraburkholderia tropica]|uniref:hypothetical protein n=1 Tax=Paraburkholderia tropica TaxID=92647 RepID=UPI00161B14FD|nr:hypothetical protein [Paraburkholderia tropica]MBB3003956.1 hypothetical protein [Paraburkholderia tropica]MBB6323450.1 hypothetical protein [Paraburkholderia tropica]
MTGADNPQQLTDPKVVKGFELRIKNGKDEAGDGLSGTFLANGACHAIAAREGGHATHAFAVAVKFVLSPTLVTPQKSLRSQWYVTKYAITIVPSVDGHEASFPLMDTSPHNTNDAKTISISTSTTWGANIGFFGDTPTGGIDVSNTKGTTYSYQVPDMKVVNESKSPRARWTFDMAGIENTQSDAIAILPKLDSPKILQINDFEPVCTAVWYASDFSEPSLTFAVKIEATFTQSYFPDPPGFLDLLSFNVGSTLVTLDRWAKSKPLEDAHQIEETFFMTIGSSS